MSFLNTSNQLFKNPFKKDPMEKMKLAAIENAKVKIPALSGPLICVTKIK